MKRTPFNDWILIAASAVFAGGGGLVLGLWLVTGGDDLREWLSALSGWIAAGAAIVIGMVTLRPIARQAALQEAAYNLSAGDRFVTLKLETENWLIRVNLARQLLTCAKEARFFEEGHDDENDPTGPVHGVPNADNVITLFRRSASEIRDVAMCAARSSFPGTRDPRLPHMARKIEDAIMHLYAPLAGISSLVPFFQSVGQLPKDGDALSWNRFLEERLSRYDLPMIEHDETGQVVELPAYVFEYRRLLDAEIARHR